MRTLMRPSGVSGLPCGSCWLIRLTWAVSRQKRALKSLSLRSSSVPVFKPVQQLNSVEFTRQPEF